MPFRHDTVCLSTKMHNQPFFPNNIHWFCKLFSLLSVPCRKENTHRGTGRGWWGNSCCFRGSSWSQGGGLQHRWFRYSSWSQGGGLQHRWFRYSSWSQGGWSTAQMIQVQQLITGWWSIAQMIQVHQLITGWVIYSTDDSGTAADHRVVVYSTDYSGQQLITGWCSTAQMIQVQQLITGWWSTAHMIQVQQLITGWVIYNTDDRRY